MCGQLGEVPSPPPPLHSPAIVALLSLAEYHQWQRNPSESVRCLMAAISLQPAPRIEARVRVQLGLALYHHTHNHSEAREQLERAVRGGRGGGGEGREGDGWKECADPGACLPVVICYLHIIHVSIYMYMYSVYTCI